MNKHLTLARLHMTHLIPGLLVLTAVITLSLFLSSNDNPIQQLIASMGAIVPFILSLIFFAGTNKSMVRFINTLPFSRKEMFINKFCCCLAVPLLCNLIGFSLALVYSLIHPDLIAPFKHSFTIAYIFWSLSMLFLALALPVYTRWSDDHPTIMVLLPIIYLLIFIVLASFSLYILAQLIPWIPMDYPETVGKPQWMIDLASFVFHHPHLSGFIAWAPLLTISFFFSLHIWNKRSF